MSIFAICINIEKRKKINFDFSIFVYFKMPLCYNLRTGYFYLFSALSSVRIEYRIPIPMVMGSNPLGRVSLTANCLRSFLVQLMNIISNSINETEKSGSELADVLKDKYPFVVLLYGDVGAGKTAFVRGFTKIISPNSRVKSPTYTIVNEYLSGKRPLYHFDLYRIESYDDFLSIGFDEYLSHGDCIVEWSEKLPVSVPGAVTVRINKLDDEKRSIDINYPD